jgi:hypothetical protein
MEKMKTSFIPAVIYWTTLWSIALGKVGKLGPFWFFQRAVFNLIIRMMPISALKKGPI